MLFGLANAGSVYIRMLDIAMKEVARDLKYSGKPWAQFGHLTQVVLAHAAAGIKIQPCKTKLFHSEVEYLGHKIRKVPEYVQKIKD